MDPATVAANVFVAPLKLGARPRVANDSITDGIDQIASPEPADSAAAEGAEISLVGSDGKLNKVAKRSNWATPSAYPTVLKAVNSSTHVLLDSAGLEVNDGTYTVKILFADFDRNVSMREIDVCDSGTPKKMLILGSAPYTP
jgi:hypothetical protein